MFSCFIKIHSFSIAGEYHSGSNLIICWAVGSERTPFCRASRHSPAKKEGDHPILQSGAVGFSSSFLTMCRVICTAYCTASHGGRKRYFCHIKSTVSALLIDDRISWMRRQKLRTPSPSSIPIFSRVPPRNFFYLPKGRRS